MEGTASIKLFCLSYHNLRGINKYSSVIYESYLFVFLLVFQCLITIVGHNLKNVNIRFQQCEQSKVYKQPLYIRQKQQKLFRRIQIETDADKVNGRTTFAQVFCYRSLFVSFNSYKKPKSAVFLL